MSGDAGMSELGRSDSETDRGTHPTGPASSLRLLTSEEAAEITGLHRKTLNRLAREGALPVVTITDRPGAAHRFLLSDLETFIRERRRRCRPAPEPTTRRARRVADPLSPWE